MATSNEPKQVHITLQGKGGVGKSYIAFLIAQHLFSRGGRVACVDIDPINKTLASYRALNARAIELIHGSTVDRRKIDELIHMLLTEDIHFVIDSGASSFVPLSSYLIENQSIEMLSEHKQVLVHTVITGGRALPETLQGFDALASHLPPQAELFVWLNSFFGPIETIDGKPFEQMKAYIKHKSRIAGLVTIQERSRDLFGKDVREMLSLNLTFNEVMEREDFYFMAKHRLNMIRKEISDQLDRLL